MTDGLSALAQEYAGQLGVEATTLPENVDVQVHFDGQGAAPEPQPEGQQHRFMVNLVCKGCGAALPTDTMGAHPIQGGLMVLLGTAPHSCP